MAFEKFITLSLSDFTTLSTTGTVTIGGTTLTYQPDNVLYLVPTDDVSGTNDGTNWTSLTIGSITKAIPSGCSTTLSGLTDTNISSPSNGQMLKYDNASSKWVNAAVPTEIPSQTGNSGKFLTTNGSAVSWDNVPSELPTITGNANKILAVNSGATGVEWVTPSSGLTNYDFTHISNTTVSTSSTTITFAANTRGSQMITVSDDIAISFVVNNDSDNYLWIENSDTTNNIDVTISSVTHNGNVVSNVRMPRDGIAVPAGGTCEIGIVCNTDGAFITSRDDLE